MMQEHIVCECVNCQLGEEVVTVLKLLAEGFTINQTAEKMQYAPATIKRWRIKAYKYLGAHTSAEATAKAIKQGLI